MTPRNRAHQMAGLFILLGSLSVISPLAKDFWVEKPFDQWTEKEVIKILSDSPWGKTQMIFPGGGAPLDMGMAGGGGPPFGGGGAPGGGAPAGGGAGGGVAPGGAGGPGGLGGAGGAGPGIGGPGAIGPPPTIPFQVTWYSSLKVRQAMMRLGQLRGTITEEQANKVLKQPMESYMLAVSSPMMKPFQELNTQNFKGRTFLLSKKNKHKKIELKEYISPKDRLDGLALFVFPRQDGGKSLLDSDDEEAQFVTTIGPIQIKASFKLAKMTTEGKLDL